MPLLSRLRAPGRRPRLAVGAVGFSLHQICEAAVPVTVGVIIDAAIAPTDPVALVVGIAALGVVFFVLAQAWRAGELASTRLFVELDYSTRRELVEHLLSPLTRLKHSSGPDAEERGSSSGEHLSTLTIDAEKSSLIGLAVARLISLGGALLVGAVALLVVSVPLGLAVLVVTPALLFVMHLASRPLEKRSGAEQAALATASGVTTDLLSGLRTIKGLNAEPEAYRRFRTANDHTPLPQRYERRTRKVFSKGSPSSPEACSC